MSTVDQINQIEQARRTLAMQRQQLTMQTAELESALKELESATESYTIVGNIMVKKEKETLKSNLSEKQTTLKTRLDQLKQQEKQLSEKATKLRQSLAND